MSLDKTDKKPLGLKITNLITNNIIWYLIFSLIYWNLNPLNWWLVTSIWGRVILIFLEYGLIMSSFNDKKNEKS
jgi:hypothetical protein